nr:uncharacterized protein LOC112278406 isoform X4 [Physcomitrium patens]|eukprot:XP_024367631.1 uncharacterized protein LOC112278406 isoform X4 [Physcomitrella patens]
MGLLCCHNFSLIPRVPLALDLAVTNLHIHAISDSRPGLRELGCQLWRRTGRRIFMKLCDHGHGVDVRVPLFNCHAPCRFGIACRYDTASRVKTHDVQCGGVSCSDTSRPSNCSLKKVGGVERVRHPTLASVKRSNESTINSTTKESPIQVREGRPSFRIMAEGNMWLLEFEASGLRVLADPWLFGNQTFWDQAWLYTGRSQSQQRDGLPGDLTLEYVNSIDAIIITQEWEDHCHLPTLKMLRKDVPVLASPKAAVVVQRLGFTDVTDLAHGTSSQISGLKVWATVGGRVGPPWALRENGFVLQEMQTGLRLGTCCGVHTKGLGLPSLRISTSSECTKHCKDVIGETLMLCRIYYEPHCSFDEESVRSLMW